ncbi:MAG: hypothetical protein AAF467_24830 [Actinomycetota bacterium]
MAVWDTLRNVVGPKVRAWLDEEAAELSDIASETESQLSAEMDRREARLNETPEDAMARIQAEIEANDAKLDALSDKVLPTIYSEPTAEMDAIVVDDDPTA